MQQGSLPLPHAVMQWYCSIWGRRPGTRGGGFTEAIMLITARRDAVTWGLACNMLL